MKRRDFLKLTLTSTIIAATPVSIVAENGKTSSVPTKIYQKDGSARTHFKKQPNEESIYLLVENNTDTSIYVRFESPTGDQAIHQILEIYHGKELQEHIPYGWTVEFLTINENNNEQKKWHEFIVGQEDEAARVIEIDVDTNKADTLFIAEQIGKPD